MTRSTRAAFAGLALVGALGLAACGDTGDNADDAPTDAPADTDAECTAAGATVTVEIGDFVFDPTPVEVDRCDEVVWHNAHDQAHTSTGGSSQSWNTGNLKADATSEPVAFPSSGTFTYTCALHPFMEGTVEVS